MAANDGRFAGNDEDSKKAKQNALDKGARDTTGYDSSPVENKRTPYNPDQPGTDEAAHRGSAQADSFTGNAQNVNGSPERPLDNDPEAMRHARNKAQSGSQDHDESMPKNT